MRRQLTDYEQLEQRAEYYKINPIPNLNFGIQSLKRFHQIVAEKHESRNDWEKERIFRQHLYQICEANKRKIILTAQEEIRKYYKRKMK